MGQTVSQPVEGKTLQVIGAGLSRTGTTSFGHALSVLLDGPCYHGGTQMLNSPEAHIKHWIDVLEHTPAKTSGDKEYVLKNVKQLLDGYVACTDLPSNAFVTELMEIYPDAKVICTVRDPDKWWASLAPVVEHGNLAMLNLMLTFVPTLRWFRKYHDKLDEGQLGQRYFRAGEPQRPSRVMWERHIEFLKANVPKDRLFFYDVRDGWEPLCAMLGVPVPKDTPFPKLNDAKVMEDFMKKNVKKGLMAWAGVTVGAIAGAYGAFRYYQGM